MNTGKLQDWLCFNEPTAIISSSRGKYRKCFIVKHREYQQCSANYTLWFPRQAGHLVVKNVTPADNKRVKPKYSLNHSFLKPFLDHIAVRQLVYTSLSWLSDNQERFKYRGLSPLLDAAIPRPKVTKARFDTASCDPPTMIVVLWSWI